MTKIKSYVDRKCTGPRVLKMLFLILLATFAWPCLQNSCNLGPFILQSPVHVVYKVQTRLNLQKPDNWQPNEEDGKSRLPGSIFVEITNWHRRRESTSFRMRNLAFGNGKAIILIRNPYDAVISLWTHQFLDGNVRV